MADEPGAVESMVTGTMPGFWCGKRVLLTGHTGFKGGWLALWLKKQGAEVTGIALPPTTSTSLYSCASIGDGIASHMLDIRDSAALLSRVKAAQPEVIFHLAAQPLVRAGYRAPLDTYGTNVMGTANLLEAMRDVPTLRVAVMVTTDKVYRNLEWPYPYREDDHLGGHDPYSASKAASEIVIASYRDAFLAQQGVALASARAGNVIGGGDWAEDRLIPDAVRAWQTDATLEIRRPAAIRPWQHVLEALAGYLLLAEKLWQEPGLAGPFNFGPPTQDAASVRAVIELARNAYGEGKVSYTEDESGLHEAGWLALETAKARVSLGFSPVWGLTETVNRTMAWYRAMHQGEDARRLCELEIDAYEACR